MPSLFSRKSATSPVEETPGEPEVVVDRSRSYTPSKKDLGKITPKRAQGGRKPEPPPANAREARKRMRDKQRQAQLERRQGMMAGVEEHLQPRDKGPERSLARDVVDARRNLASYFLPVAFLVIIATFGAPAIAAPANTLMLVVMFGIIADSYLLTRRLKKALAAKFPKSTTPPSRHYMYAITRSLSVRRFRIPTPKVKPGEKV